ncbi:hypothetical protein [Leifsonia sp. 2MCAF36]|uniref:hypothetical protein n=1 Tax=Leifsonia sp. 2MCAF36 TaxID=3232988 RepID=UPI003F95017D
MGELISAYVKAGYPAASTSEVSTATTIYLVGLALVGICGVVLWGIAIAATRAGKWWTPWFVTSAMVVGIAVGLFDLMVRDTNGETGLPALVGWLGLAPSAAGVLAVALLWIKPAAPRPMPGHPSY